MNWGERANGYKWCVKTKLSELTSQRVMQIPHSNRNKYNNKSIAIME